MQSKTGSCAWQVARRGQPRSWAHRPGEQRGRKRHLCQLRSRLSPCSCSCGGAGQQVGQGPAGSLSRYLISSLPGEVTHPLAVPCSQCSTGSGSPHQGQAAGIGVSVWGPAHGLIAHMAWDSPPAASSAAFSLCLCWCLVPKLCPSPYGKLMARGAAARHRFVSSRHLHAAQLRSATRRLQPQQRRNPSAPPALGRADR